MVWLHDVKHARDKFDLLRFDASGAVSSGMFPEDWPRYVLKMATGAGKTKVLSLLIAWSFFHKLYEPDSWTLPAFLVPDVFDKRAVEKGQVRFADVAYIEVAPRYDKKNALAVTVELTDFSVYYSQGVVESISAEVKEGRARWCASRASSSRSARTNRAS